MPLTTRLKKRAAIAAAAALLLAGTASGAARAAEKWTAYTYNSVATHISVKGLKALFDTIEKETNGNLSIRLHVGGTLPITATNITQAVADNIVQVGDDAFFVGSVPAGGVVRLPLFIQTMPQFEKAWDAAAPHVREEYAKKNVVLLGRYIFPINVLWSRKKLTTLKDLAGQKIRVVSPEQAEFVKLFGGIPITLGTSEVAGALDRGVIDGVTTASSGYGYVWRELLKYSYRLPVSYVDSLILVNKGAWDKLSPEMRKTVQAAVDEQTKRSTAALGEEDDTLTKRLAAEGMTITVPTPEEIAEAEERMRPYWASWAESRGPAEKQAMAAVRSAIGR